MIIKNQLILLKRYPKIKLQQILNLLIDFSLLFSLEVSVHFGEVNLVYIFVFAFIFDLCDRGDKRNAPRFKHLHF